MAIDRDLITKQIFNGTATPATGWVSPVVDGYKADACGESCKFDAAKAKAAFDAAGGYKGTLTMTYNARRRPQGRGPRRSATRSRTPSVSTASQADRRLRHLQQPRSTRTELKGIFRAGWQMDYPSIENFLTPIYAKGADRRTTSDYDNPEFDEAAEAGGGGQDRRTRPTRCTSRPRRCWPTDFPTAPLWYSETTSAGRTR